MSKSQPFLLLASSLTLLGCSQVGSNSSSSIEAPTGSEIEKEVMTAHYAKAIEEMNDAKAIGLALSGEAKVNGSVESYLTQSGENNTYSQTIKAEISDLSASFAMKLDGEDAKMSAKASAKYAYESSAIGALFDSEPNVSYSGDASAAIYYDEKTLYADLTGLSSLFSIFSTSPELDNLKLKQAVSSPSFDWEFVDEALEDFSEISDASDFIQAKDGTYSFVYSIDPSALSDSSSETYPINMNWEGNIKAWLSFTDDGFSEAGFTANFAQQESSSGDEGWGTISGHTNKTDVSASLKASFSYGDKVKVEEVSDPDSYVDPSSKAN